MSKNRKDHRHEARQFDVSGVGYVVSYSEDNEFSFYVDVENSKGTSAFKSMISHGDLELDLLFNDFDSGDSDIESLFFYGRVPVKPGDVFRVKREVITFVNDMIKKHNPYFFKFSSNDKNRFELYSKLGKRLAKSINYIMEIYDASMYDDIPTLVFAFFRKNAKTTSP